MKKRQETNKICCNNRVGCKMSFALILGAIIILHANVYAIDTSLKIQYLFNSLSSSNLVFDDTGNGNDATLKSGAIVRKLGRFNVLDLGLFNGYLDMGTKTGLVIQSLTDFTISTYVYIDPSVDLTIAGNFIWSFANSTDMANAANGNMFLSAITTRYAISQTNWMGESTVNPVIALTKGAWQHVTYTQSGNTGIIYINGRAVKSGTIVNKPSNIGSTKYNYLCRSCYAGDAYLTNSMLNDFRVYNRALSANEVVSLASQKSGLDSALIIQPIIEAKTNLILNGLDEVVSNLNLPTSGGNGVTITWNSSNTNIISNQGTVTRPTLGSDTALVSLTATFSKSEISDTKVFNANILPLFSDRISVQRDSINLILAGNLNLLRSNLVLPASGVEGSVINWSSDNNSLLSSSGTIISRPQKGTGNGKVTLTATIKKGTETATKTFIVYVAEDEGFSAYIFAYFTGNTGDQESIRFALSDDGYVYTALNNNNPVLNSTTISSSGGVRDPHILRGVNNDYYMVATDMMSALGWTSNRALVMLKSTDLINWQYSGVNVPNTYPEYSAADEVWAPQTIYDPTVGKYMVYFAMRLGPTDYDRIYYAYANSTFSGFESAPKVLFDNNGLSTIDPDIVLKDGIYNLFFKTEGNGNGIKKAISNNLTSGYVLYNKYLECTTNPVEGGCAFRMINSDDWILMYDEYTSGTYQLTNSTDLINFSIPTNPVSFDFTPRHGTVMPITAAEKEALNAKWGTKTNASIEKANTSIFSINPNIVKGILNINVSDLTLVLKVSVFDLSGKELINKSIRGGKTQVDVSHLSKGIFIFRGVTENGDSDFQKFIVS